VVSPRDNLGQVREFTKIHVVIIHYRWLLLDKGEIFQIQSYLSKLESLSLLSKPVEVHTLVRNIRRGSSLNRHSVSAMVSLFRLVRILVVIGGLWLKLHQRMLVRKGDRSFASVLAISTSTFALSV